MERFGTVYTDYPEDIGCALLRANAWWKIDPTQTIFAIASRNREEPLTEEEKARIVEYLTSKQFPYKVLFG